MTMMKQQKFWTCETVFLNSIDAGIAIGKLAIHGIAATQFTDVKDIEPDTVYYGLWRPCDFEDDPNNFEATVMAVAGELGGCDCFHLSDHKPIASDFNFAAENDTVS
jgi:hypothetical protein